MSEITRIKVGDKTYDISDGAAITAITLNGEAVPVEDGVAKLEVSGGGAIAGVIIDEGSIRFKGENAAVMCAEEHGDQWALAFRNEDGDWDTEMFNSFSDIRIDTDGDTATLELNGGACYYIIFNATLEE